MIIKYIDPNVDGCGTNVECLVDVGVPEISSDLRLEIQNAVNKYKKCNHGEWDSDTLFQIASEIIEDKGYRVNYVTVYDEIVL